MNRADRCSVRTCWSFGVTQTNQFLGEVWVNERGQRISRPLTPRRSWLRGLDLNQRPLGYEYNTAMTGNPLILREKHAAAPSSTLSAGASSFISFRPVSGCCGSKMGADSARCVRHEPLLGVRVRPDNSSTVTSLSPPVLSRGMSWETHLRHKS